MEYFKSSDNFRFDAACELSKKDDDTQIAILLHTAGAGFIYNGWIYL